MANIHGAIAVCEKRILTKWDTLAQNRAELEKICAEPEKKGPQQEALVSARLERVHQLLAENRSLLQDIEKQYLALFKVRHR